MNYDQYIEKFRNWQMEKDERIFEKPMNEKKFENWMQPAKETEFTRQEKLSYKEIYLRLKKLLTGKDELLKQLEEAYLLNQQKLEI